jgi:hypothetical protein
MLIEIEQHVDGCELIIGFQRIKDLVPFFVVMPFSNLTFHFWIDGTACFEEPRSCTEHRRWTLKRDCSMGAHGSRFPKGLVKYWKLGGKC